MKNKKTLIILSPAFPENEAADYWVPSQQLMVKALKKNYPGLHVIVIALLYPYSCARYTWNGVEVISFDGTHRRKLKRVRLWYDVWKKMKSIYQENEVIGILSFWCGECAFIGNYFAKGRSLKHFIWICGQDARSTNNWVRFIRPKKEQLMAMSSFLMNEFYKNHKIKPQHIVSNAIDPGMFHAMPGATRDIDVLGAGSFEPLKQYDVFVRVIKDLSKEIVALQARHCGIGRERKKIEAQVMQLSLEKNLQLLGGKSHDEVLQLMHRTNVFLHTSNYEGSSTVCLEALNAGAHVVSFCYPLDYPVSHWHVVKSEKEMTEKALEILQDQHIEYTPILLYRMDDSAKEVMSLINSTGEGHKGKTAHYNLYESQMNNHH